MIGLVVFLTFVFTGIAGLIVMGKLCRDAKNDEGSAFTMFLSLVACALGLLVSWTYLGNRLSGH